MSLANSCNDSSLAVFCRRALFQAHFVLHVMRAIALSFGFHDCLDHNASRCS